MSKPIFILNAPPQTGKDTIAANILMRTDAGTCSMKDPMFNVFCATTGIDFNDFMELYETPGWKDTPQGLTNGKTPRELMIHISENFVKPFFGDDYYGKALAKYILDTEDLLDGQRSWVIPDGGFQGEFDAFKRIHGDRVVLIRMEREGHRDFTGDSRNWIYDVRDTLEGPEEHGVWFDTTEGNEKAIKFMEGMINAA